MAAAASRVGQPCEDDAGRLAAGRRIPPTGPADGCARRARQRAARSGGSSPAAPRPPRASRTVCSAACSASAAAPVRHVRPSVVPERRQPSGRPGPRPSWSRPRRPPRRAPRRPGGTIGGTLRPRTSGVEARHGTAEQGAARKTVDRSPARFGRPRSGGSFPRTGSRAPGGRTASSSAVCSSALIRSSPTRLGSESWGGARKSRRPGQGQRRPDNGSHVMATAIFSCPGRGAIAAPKAACTSETGWTWLT
jgi:hypothetical protein